MVIFCWEMPGGVADDLAGEDLDGVDGGEGLLDVEDVDDDVLPACINILQILEPAKQSVSKYLARSRTTLPLMWIVPNDTPSRML